MVIKKTAFFQAVPTCHSRAIADFAEKKRNDFTCILRNEDYSFYKCARK